MEQRRDRKTASSDLLLQERAATQIQSAFRGAKVRHSRKEKGQKQALQRSDCWRPLSTALGGRHDQAERLIQDPRGALLGFKEWYKWVDIEELRTEPQGAGSCSGGVTPVRIRSGAGGPTAETLGTSKLAADPKRSSAGRLPPSQEFVLQRALDTRLTRGAAGQSPLTSSQSALAGPDACGVDVAGTLADPSRSSSIGGMQCSSGVAARSSAQISDDERIRLKLEALGAQLRAEINRQSTTNSC